MFRMPTLGTAKKRLRNTGICVHVLALDLTASLGRKSGTHVLRSAAAPQKLVRQHVIETGPSRIGNASCAPTSNHSVDVQFLKYNDAVALGITVAESVKKMLALSPYLTVNLHHSNLGLLPILGPLLSSTDGALRPRESFESFFVVSRRRHEFSIRVTNDVHYATVNCHDRANARRQIVHLQLARDRDEPLVTVTLERARLRLSFKRSVDHSSQVPELWETNRLSIQTPDLRMRFAERKEIASLSLPTRRFCYFLETALPRLVKLDEQLVAHVSRNVIEPRNFCPQFRSFVDLIERRRKHSLVSWARISHSALLVRKIPERPERVFPRMDAYDLLRGRVNPVPEGFGHAHGDEYALVHVQYQRFSYRQTRCICLDGSLGLRATLLEPELLRRFVRRSATQNCQTIRGKSTRRGFLPVLKGGVSASEIR